MKKIDKNTKWWIGAEKEWSFQDKNGDWWLVKDKEKKEEKTTRIGLGNEKRI